MRKHFLRILTVLFAVCLGACLFAACGDGDDKDPDNAETYTLTYNANGGTGADISESYKEGEAVTLKGAETFTRENYTLTKWNDGTKDYALGAAFTMPGKNVTLKAQWEQSVTPPATYTVTMAANENAVFTIVEPAAGPYEEGTVVKFTVAAKAGYTVKSVKNGDAVLTAAEGKYSVTVGKANIVITVETAATYTVTMAANENAVFTIVEPAAGPYEEGTVVKFTVAAKTGYTVKSVKNGDAVLTAADGKYSVTVGKANIVITVETEAEPVLDPIEGVWTAEVSDALIGGGGEATIEMRIIVKKNGNAVDAIILFVDPATHNQNGMAFHAPKTGDDQYGIDGMGTLSVAQGKLTLGELFGEDLTLTERSTDLGTFDAPESGTYSNSDEGVSVTFGEHPTVIANDMEIPVEFVEVGAYIVCYPTNEDDRDEISLILCAGDEGGLNAITGETTFALTEGALPAGPVFRFEKGEATGDDPEIEVGEPNDQGLYTVEMPENPYTAPENKYFRGWEIGGIVYFPGEKADLEKGGVTVTAIWEDLYVAYEQDVTISHTWTDPVNVLVAEGAPAAELTATVSDSAMLSEQDAWHGILVDVNMTIKGATQANFIRLRVDGFIFAYAPDETNIGQIGKDVGNWDPAKYAALFADGGRAVQRVTAGLSGRILTYTIATYEADTADFTDAQPVVSVTYTVESAVDVSALTLAFYHDDGATDSVPNNTFTLENARVKSYVAVSADQSPTEQAPIEIGTADNAMAYSGDVPVWTGDLRKGEKVVLKGTMTSAAAANWQAPLMYVSDSNVFAFNFRFDNYTNGTPTFNQWPETTPNGWTISGASNEGSTAVPVGDDWWAGVRDIFKQADVELTFDHTGENILVIMKLTGTSQDAGENNGKIAMYTYTLEGGERPLGDRVFIGVGGDHNYTRITSIVRTSVKQAD